MASNFLLRDSQSYKLKQFPFEQTKVIEDFHASTRDAVTKKLFDDLLYSSRKEDQCAGTRWLLSLTMYCGLHLTIQQLLPKIQEACSHLLGDQNELTQELASQGMSIVYEPGGASMKTNLVYALVHTLSGSGKQKSRRETSKLVESTEVFQDGALGESISEGCYGHIWKSLVANSENLVNVDLGFGAHKAS